MQSLKGINYPLSVDRTAKKQTRRSPSHTRHWGIRQKREEKTPGPALMQIDDATEHVWGQALSIGADVWGIERCVWACAGSPRWPNRRIYRYTRHSIFEIPRLLGFVQWTRDKASCSQRQRLVRYHDHHGREVNVQKMQ